MHSKTETKTHTVTTTYFISDDNKFKSIFQNEVEDYEKSIIKNKQIEQKHFSFPEKNTISKRSDITSFYENWYKFKNKKEVWSFYSEQSKKWYSNCWDYICINGDFNTEREVPLNEWLACNIYGGDYGEFHVYTVDYFEKEHPEFKNIIEQLI